MNNTTIWPESFTQDGSGARALIWEPPAPGPGECPNCGGLGFMYRWIPKAGPFHRFPAGDTATFVDGEGWYTGSREGAPCPVCSGGARELYLIKNSGLHDDELKVRLDHFRPLPGKERALKTAQKILAMTPRPYGFYTFHGDYGTGKTTILMALINGFRVAGLPATYARMADLLAEVRSGFADNPREAAEAILERYKRNQAMAIDEIDRVNVTPWVRETMFRLLDGRYQDQARTLTLLATNTKPENLPEDLAYLASRMNGGVVTEIGGADVRMAIGLQKARSQV